MARRQRIMGWISQHGPPAEAAFRAQSSAAPLKLGCGLLRCIGGCPFRAQSSAAPLKRRGCHLTFAT